MDKLPEEIVDRVIAHLGPHFSESVTQLRDFANVVLVSRLFNRIATPHLYKSVPITVSEVIEPVIVFVGSVDGPPSVFDAVTTKGCNAYGFLECLQGRPSLAAHVKHMTLIRDDIGFLQRLTLGWYGYEKESPVTANFHWTEIERAARTGRPIDSSRLLSTIPLTPVACLDEGFVTVRALLRVLPNIQQLDCTRYRTDVLWDPAAEAFKSLHWHPTPQVEFRSLQTVKLHCSGSSLAKCWSVFMLPSVQTLHLEAANLITAAKSDLSEGWGSLHSSHVKRLELPELIIHNWDQAEENVIYLMLKACKQLCSLFIESKPPCQSRLLLDAIGRHSPGLRDLKVITYPLPTRAIHGIEKIFPIPSNPSTPFMPVFRASTGLESLTLDVTDLLEIVEKSELSETHTGILDPHTFVMAPHRELLVNVDLTLPRSLTSLTLRVSNGARQRAGITKALRALIQQLNGRLPLLKRLETSWQVPSPAPSGKWNIGKDLAGILENAGVEYVETCFPDGATIHDYPAPGPEDW